MSFSVIKLYIRSGGVLLFAMIVFAFMNRFVARVWYSWSLSQWTNDAEEAAAIGSSSSSFSLSSSEVQDRIDEVNNHYIFVQGMLVLYEFVVYFLVGAMWMFFGRRASSKIQSQFIKLITFAKASFYDTFVSTEYHVMFSDS